LPDNNDKMTLKNKKMITMIINQKLFDFNDHETAFCLRFYAIRQNLILFNNNILIICVLLQKKKWQL